MCIICQQQQWLTTESVAQRTTHIHISSQTNMRFVLDRARSYGVDMIRTVFNITYETNIFGKGDSYLSLNKFHHGRQFSKIDINGNSCFVCECKKLKLRRVSSPFEFVKSFEVIPF